MTRPTFGDRAQSRTPQAFMPAPAVTASVRGTVSAWAIPVGSRLGSGHTVAFGWVNWDEEWPAVIPAEALAEERCDGRDPE